MGHTFQFLLGVALLGSAGVAGAEPAHPHVVVLRPVQVSGRIQTPLAAVERFSAAIRTEAEAGSR